MGLVLVVLSFGLALLSLFFMLNKINNIVIGLYFTWAL